MTTLICKDREGKYFKKFLHLRDFASSLTIGIMTFLRWVINTIIPSYDSKPVILRLYLEQYQTLRNAESFKDLIQLINEREEYAEKIHCVQPA